MPDFHQRMELLIIDIDDTFVYHRTVMAANRVFLYYLLGKRYNVTTSDAIRKILLNIFDIRINYRVLYLLYISIVLHIYNIIRLINNRFFKIISCERMIKIWMNTVIRLKIPKDVYEIRYKLDKDMVNVFKNIKKKKVLALTQSFSFGEDRIKDILGVDYIVNNMIYGDKIINDYEIKIKDGNDKLKIAKDYIKKLKPKDIGLIIEDYDDIGLLQLPDISLVIASNRLKRFIDEKGFSRVNKRFIMVRA
jgi:hypothetical protein